MAAEQKGLALAWTYFHMRIPPLVSTLLLMAWHGMAFIIDPVLETKTPY